MNDIILGDCLEVMRWWWPPDRKKAKLLTVLLNSDTFKKARFMSSAPAPNPFYKPSKEANLDKGDKNGDTHE